MKFEDFINDHQLNEIANLNKKKLFLKNDINKMFFICLIIWLIPIFIFVICLNFENYITSSLVGLAFLLLFFDIFFGTILLFFLYFGSTPSYNIENYRKFEYINKKPKLFNLFPIIDKRIESFISECKAKLFRSIFELLIDEFEYNSNHFFNHKEVKESKLFKEFESDNIDELRRIEITGGDFINGLFNNNLIEFCELDITFINKQSTEETNYEIFHGLFLIAHVDKNFKSETIIKAKLFGGMQDFMLKMIDPTIPRNKLKSISMQNFLFNKHYYVQGSDEIETRKILSPIVLENLANFAEKHPQEILISLINNKMYFALKIGSFLSPDLTDLLPSEKLNKNLLKNDLFRIYEEINLIISILNDLRLNSPNKYLS